MTGELPIPIRSYLRASARRRRTGAVVRSAGFAAFFALSWFILACGLDRLLHLPRTARAALLAGQIVGVVVLLGRSVWRALVWPVDYVDESHHIEISNPIFGQRLETVVSQLQAPQRQRGSRELLTTLTAGVVERLRSSDVRTPTNWSRTPWIAVVAALICLAAMSQVRTIDLSALAHRFYMPLAHLPAVTTSSIVSVDPGDRSVSPGEAVTVRVRVQHVENDAVDLQSSADGRSWAINRMSSLGGFEFGFVLGAGERDTKYRVVAGDARSREYLLSVLRQPAVIEYRIRTEYPAYLGLPAGRTTSVDATVEAPDGTLLTLQVVSSEPLRSASLIGGSQRINLLATNDPTIWEAKLSVHGAQIFELEMVSTGAVMARAVSPVVVRALADRPPTVQLIEPLDDLRVAATDQMRVRYAADDDFAIGALSGWAQVEGRAAREVPLHVRDDLRHQEGEFVADMSALALRAGDVVAIWLTALDRMPKRSAVQSEVRHLLVVSRPPDVFLRRRVAELQDAARLAAVVDAQLDDASKTFEKARSRAQGEADRQALVVRVNQSLSTAAEAAGALHQAILAAIAQNAPPQTATALAAWLDRARAIHTLAERTNSALVEQSWDEGRSAQALARLAEESRALVRPLATVADGEAAAMALADWDELRALRKSAGPHAAEDRLARALGVEVGVLGTSLNAADAARALRKKLDEALTTIAARGPVDFEAAAREWAVVKSLREGLSHRLSSAALAESVRIDSDAQWALDLLLAARATSAMEADATATTLPSASAHLPEAIGAICRAHLSKSATTLPATQPGAMSADEARRQLTLWAGLSAESDAHELALRAIEATDRRDFATAAQLDQKAAMVAKEPLQRGTGKTPAIDSTRELLARIDAALAAQRVIQSAGPDVGRQQAEISREIGRLADAAHAGEGGGLTVSPDARRAELADLAAVAAMVAKLPADANAARLAAEELAAASQRVARAQQMVNGSRPAQQAAAAKQLQAARQLQTQADGGFAEVIKAIGASKVDEIQKRITSAGAEDAVSAIATQLRPALASFEGSLRANDRRAAEDRLAELSRASQTTVATLDAARERLLKADPLVEAQLAAESASSLLVEGRSDIAQIKSRQDTAANALAGAYADRARELRTARLSRVPALAGAYGAAPPQGPVTGGRSAPMSRSVARKWGALRRMTPTAIPTTGEPAETAEFQDALRAYFERIHRVRADVQSK